MSQYESFRQDVKAVFEDTKYDVVKLDENVGLDKYHTVAEIWHSNNDIYLICNIHPTTGEKLFILDGDNIQQEEFTAVEDAKNRLDEL